MTRDTHGDCLLVCYFLTGWHSPTITDRAIDTVSCLLKSREHPSVILKVLSPSKSLKSKYLVIFAKTLNEAEFCFVQSFCKNHMIFRLKNFTGW